MVSTHFNINLLVMSHCCLLLGRQSTLDALWCTVQILPHSRIQLKLNLYFIQMLCPISGTPPLRWSALLFLQQCCLLCAVIWVWHFYKLHSLIHKPDPSRIPSSAAFIFHSHPSSTFLSLGLVGLADHFPSSWCPGQTLSAFIPVLEDKSFGGERGSADDHWLLTFSPSI